MSTTAQGSAAAEQTIRRSIGAQREVSALRRNPDRPREGRGARAPEGVSRPAGARRESSRLPTGPLGAVPVRISALTLSCLAVVAAVVAARQPDCLPYLVAGGGSGLVLTLALALLCRAGLSSGDSSTSSAHASSREERP